MSDPGPLALPLLKLDFTRYRPSEGRLADGGEVYYVDDTRRSDDPRFDVPPGFAATGPQTFPANIAFKASADVVSGIGIGKGIIYDVQESLMHLTRQVNSSPAKCVVENKMCFPAPAGSQYSDTCPTMAR